MTESNRSHRRSFLKRTAVFAAGSLGRSVYPPFGMAETANPAAPVLPERLVLLPVAYRAVQLTPGVPERQRRETVAVLLALTDDELLKPYRARSDKPAPGNDLGGWYDAHAYCPGHTFGQWLSAFARTYAIDGDPQVRARVQGLVSGLADSFDAKGSFFGGDNRFPAYTLEKLNCGLVDALAFADDAQAADVLRQVNRLAQPYLPEKALSRAEQRKRSTRDVTYTFDETYTLPENYFLAYQRTGDRSYLELAQKFMHTTFLDPLAERENVLAGLHAYSHLNTLNSAAQAYLVLGDAKMLAAAVNGFDFVQQQSYANGGWGPNEAFVTPGRGELARSLQETHSSFETPCGAYGHFKITRSLLSITGDGRYGDSMEAVMLNTILGSLPLQPNGDSFYYADFNMQGKKAYSVMRWPCCSGTLAQAASDYRINSYLLGTNGMHVNLYVPSTVHYVDRGIPIELEQSGRYPIEEDIQFTVRPQHAATFMIAFRIPAWAGDGVRLRINDRAVPLPPAVKGFSSIQRHWKRGDRVVLHIPLPFRLLPIDPETPNLVALMRGPLLLYGVGAPATVTERALLSARQSAASEWVVETTAGDRRLTSFDRLGDAAYSTYHRLA